MTKDGIGAPLVAVRHLTVEQAAALFTPPQFITASRASWNSKVRAAFSRSSDPLAAETVTVEGRTYPMAANFTASLAMVLAQEKPQKLGLIRLLRPEEYASTSRVARMEPYNPNKSVVLVIHGLMDTPATWVPMLNDLRSDKEIRPTINFGFTVIPAVIPILIARSSSARNSTPSKRNIRCANRWWW